MYFKEDAMSWFDQGHEPNGLSISPLVSDMATRIGFGSVLRTQDG